MTNEADLPARRPSSVRKVLDELDLLLKGKEMDDTMLVCPSVIGFCPTRTPNSFWISVGVTSSGSCAFNGCHATPLTLFERP